MSLLVLFTFLSGVLTILAPCVWPVLPILFVTSSGGKSKPVGITAGILTTFSIFTIFVSLVLQSTSASLDTLRIFSVIFLFILGVTFLFPQLNKYLELAISKLTAKFGGKLRQSKKTGFLGGFLTGASLGILWAPCAGPIILAVAGVAASSGLTLTILLLFISYILGVGVPLLLLSLFGNKLFAKSRFINKHLGIIQQVFGALIIIVAISIYTGFDKKAQTWLLQKIPAYANITFNLETSDVVRDKIDSIEP